MENELDVSKTQRKREMSALQDLGASLVDLSADRLEALALPDVLLQAVLEAKRIRAHGARRRQMQYIGRLMRDVDAATIRTQLERVTRQGTEATALLHQAERWRARMIEDDAALEEFLQAHRDVDAQHIRTLIRNARREAAQRRPPRSFRTLFQEIRRALEPVDNH